MRGSSARLERLAHNQKAEGSNPSSAPTVLSDDYAHSGNGLAALSDEGSALRSGRSGGYRLLPGTGYIGPEMLALLGEPPG